ncbi:lipid A export permease/ATP-binding protein MsbA [Thiomicrospira cyclica]|uniref:Lipid A ABC exporter, fused ATPase and inner membrane subunits MsbA n=1 Tax=Thiomicrospira cyclica (strain DSM 14477 / JCM 11371 / ALM1) TaxID=717773 RepID=F6DCY0_THICA|nr:lipid A export permease/ATP-binding protein MsbA [Thiomicrospira cyclica]AEG31716.1 lipid A ABC exporter, fused ATPase and inner membrane subunits MsbA [Thiomicrospira cyclica ALM1]
MYDRQSLKLYGQLLRYILPYKSAIALTLFSLVLIALLEPATAYVLKDLVDVGLIEQDPNSFVILPFLLALVFIFKGVFEYISKVVSQWISERATLQIRLEMFEKLQFMTLKSFQDTTSGHLMSKITHNVSQTSQALVNAWVVLIRDTLMIIALLAYMLYVSWELTLLMLVIAPVVAFLINKASQLMRKYSRKSQENMGAVTQQLEESIHAHKDIKVYGAEQYEIERFNQVLAKQMQYNVKQVRVAALNVPLVQVIAAIALSFVVYFAMKLAADGAFTPGELVSFILAMALTFDPIRRLTSVNITLQKGLAAAESIFEFLAITNETNTGTQQPPIKGELQLNNLVFQYDRAEQPTLKGIQLTIPANQTTALVGASGSGKSTLVNLIARFYAPTSGDILLDNTPLADIELDYLRQHIAFVSQHVVLFNDSIRANIAYGHDEFDEAAIIQAAKDAHAWEFIEKLPDGLDTMIGDNGALLSGGQRQRLAIARAFLKNAPILILDEATSALDNQSEAMIQQAMAKLRQNRTVIIIAHRLSTIEQADQIAVLDQGELVELGTHRDLLAQQGAYARLQQQGELGSG